MSAIDPERIYRERALRLARLAAMEDAGSATAVLTFRVGEERYGIELDHVLEVVGRAECVPVPGAAPELAGVINLHGEIRPVWDLRRMLGGTAASRAGSVLMLRRGGRSAGLLVDRVEQTRLVRNGDWAPAAPESAYVKRATTDLLPVLDTYRLWKEASS